MRKRLKRLDNQALSTDNTNAQMHLSSSADSTDIFFTVQSGTEVL